MKLPVNNITSVLRFRNFCLAITWLLSSILIALIPFGCQILYRFVAKEPDTCILCSCNENLISMECLVDSFMEGLGVVYLTIAITTSLFLERGMYLLSASKNKITSKIVKICNFICEISFGFSFAIVLFYIGSSWSKTIYKNIETILFVEVIIFAVCVVCVTISKINLIENNKS